MWTGVRIPLIAEAYISGQEHLGTVVHELGHLLLNVDDMYQVNAEGRYDSPFAPGHYSIMDHPTGIPHLDPANKMYLGWLEPQLLKTHGWVDLQDVESTGEVVVLADFENHPYEYFLVEKSLASKRLRFL